MAEPILRQPAYVLHRRPYRETSAILELLTRDHGRVAAVARAARRARRPQLAEPFATLEVAWRGRGRLVTLTACETTRRFALTGRPLFAGLYLNELLTRALQPEEAVTALFAAYGETLTRLAAEADLEPALRTFEKRLLRELGYELAFDREWASGAPIAAEGTYELVGAEGFRATAADGVATYRGAVLRAIAQDHYREWEVRRAAKVILRKALRAHVGERPLQSRELFRAAAR